MSSLRKQTCRLLRQLTIVLSCGWCCCGKSAGNDKVIDSSIGNIERKYWSSRQTNQLENKHIWKATSKENAKEITTTLPSRNDSTKMTLQVPGHSLNSSRRSTMDSIDTFGSTRSPSYSNTSSHVLTIQPSAPSASNYCRVYTCEQLHIHELTPKCQETFAPSSTHSSCQNCDRQHIGPNHSEVLLVSQLYQHLNSSRLMIQQQQKIIAKQKVAEQVLKSQMQRSKKNKYLQKKEEDEERSKSVMEHPRDSNFWPLPDYRPQHSPDHLYRSSGFY